MKDYKNSKRFAEYLEELTDHEVYDILNDYFVQTENYGDMVYYMQDFSTVFNDTDAYDLARMVYKGDFRPTDEYFLFDTRGNIQSLSARDLKGQLETFVDELVEYGCFNSILKYFEKEEGGN